MAWWQALVLGIVEGVTEYLPVSSTGHLILVAWLLGLDQSTQIWQATNTFNIVIQGGAIVAVLWLYYGRVIQMGQGVLAMCRLALCWRGQPTAVPAMGALTELQREGLCLACNLIIALLPAAVFGPLCVGQIEQYLFKPWPVVAALMAGAWLMLAVASMRRLNRNGHSGIDLNQITWQIALLIGFGQCIAMWPGTSRSMMTIVTGLMLGMKPRAAAEFSFLLGLLTLSAATSYKVVIDGGQMLEQIDWPSLTFGLLSAAMAAAIAMHWFVRMLIRYGLAPFAWYRLAVAMCLAALLVAGVLKVPAAP